MVVPERGLNMNEDNHSVFICSNLIPRDLSIFVSCRRKFLFDFLGLWILHSLCMLQISHIKESRSVEMGCVSHSELFLACTFQPSYVPPTYLQMANTSDDISYMQRVWHSLYTSCIG